MALLQLNYVSNELFRTVAVHVILPSDRLDKVNRTYPNCGRKFKTLYLLHGLLGNYTDWVSFTNIQRYAEKHDLAVVMPSGDNAFYVNSLAPNNDYGRFIGEELVQITRAMFPLSDRREDTFIGGLSMGGFGALRNGLRYPETFSHIICLSGALHIMDENCAQIADENGIFGKMSTARLSDKNPEVCLRMLQDRIAADPSLTIPKIYLACGLDDSLLPSNRRYRDLLTAAGADVTYIEEAGYAHEWPFWDRHIGKAIDEWLPLEANEGGLSSGNVK